MISEENLKAVLKETYLEIANGYDVSDLHHDGDKVACVASKFRQKVLDKIEVSEKQVSQVYVLLEVYDMSDCVDCHGEDAGEQEEIKGIFATMNQAENKKHELEVSSKDNMNECDCDPVRYKIVPWDIE